MQMETGLSWLDSITWGIINLGWHYLCKYPPVLPSWNRNISTTKHTHIEGFLKYLYLQIIHFDRMFHCKPSILGYPHLWKPHETSISSHFCNSWHTVHIVFALCESSESPHPWWCQSGSRLWMWHLARCANLVEHLLVRWRFDPWHRSLLRSFEDVDSVMWFLSSINCCPWKSQVFNYRVCKLMRITICLKCPALLRCIGTKNGGTPHLRVLQGAIDVKDMLSVMALVAVPCLTSQEQ